MGNVCVVFVSTPRDEANKLARGLVENRLAACVNIIPKIESYFWWDNKLNHDDEALLIIKTTQQRFDDLRDWVVNNHPYDLPEVISLPLSDGLSEYIEWVKKETGKE
jgi:periplasmic divalent cation tolerance protein